MSYFLILIFILNVSFSLFKLNLFLLILPNAFLLIHLTLTIIGWWFLLITKCLVMKFMLSRIIRINRLRIRQTLSFFRYMGRNFLWYINLSFALFLANLLSSIISEILMFNENIYRWIKDNSKCYFSDELSYCYLHSS